MTLTQRIFKDLTSGTVVFLVALPLCMGIALASDAPVFSGLVAGIVGGIVVGSLSGSNTSVSGPAAGLTAIVATQIQSLGSFEAFLLAVVLAGFLQVLLGVVRLGLMQAFVPGSVIKGLLAAIGIILILKQIPHLMGHDTNAEGERIFFQTDLQNIIVELRDTLYDLHDGAAIVGLVSLAFLFGWDRIGPLKKSGIPPQLLVVLLGVSLNAVLGRIGEEWHIHKEHLVQVPVAGSFGELTGFAVFPAWSQLGNPAIYVAAVTIALVASLETLLNLEAADKLDPRHRASPANRELMAQGVGNVIAGLVGGLPVTSVIVRSSVNINAGSVSKLSAVVHGVLLATCVALIPGALNLIPLSCLAAILIHTGFKLATPAVFRKMWQAGSSQFLPFVVTILAIVLTDLLIGIVIGLVLSTGFLLYASMLHPLKLVREERDGRTNLRIELANQVTFLNRAALSNTLDEVPPGSEVTIDGRFTDYIDPDVLELIREFQTLSAPARNVEVHLVDVRDRYIPGDTLRPSHAAEHGSAERRSPT